MKKIISILLGVFLIGCSIPETESFFLTFRDYRHFFKSLPTALDGYRKVSDNKPYKAIPVEFHHDHRQYGPEKYKHHDINDEFQSNYHKHSSGGRPYGQAEYKPYGTEQHNKYYKNEHKCVHHHHHHDKPQSDNNNYEYEQNDSEYFDNRRSHSRDQTATSGRKSEESYYVPPEHRKGGNKRDKTVKDYVSGILVVVPKVSKNENQHHGNDYHDLERDHTQYENQHHGNDHHDLERGHKQYENQHHGNDYHDLERDHTQYYDSPKQDESDDYSKFVKEYLTSSFPDEGNVEDGSIGL